MEFFIAFDVGGLIIAIIVGIVLIFYAVIFGIEDFVSYIHSNELKMFVTITIILAVIAVIAYLFMRKELDKSSLKFSTFLSLISASICISHTLFYFINSLVSSIFDAHDGFDLVFRVVLGSIPWLFFVLLVLLLVLGVPSLAMIGVYIGTSCYSDKPLINCFGGLLNIVISIICAYFVVHPALIGNFNIYEII